MSSIYWEIQISDFLHHNGLLSINTFHEFLQKYLQKLFFILQESFQKFFEIFFQEFLQYLCLSFLTDSWSFIFQNFQKHGLSQKLAQDFSHKFLQKFLIKFFWIFLWSHLKEFIKVLPEEGFSWRIPWTTKLKDSLFSDISTKKRMCI